MPCPEKFRESLILFGLPETLIRQINGGFEQLVSSSPKKQKAAYFQHAAEVMSAALEEDDLRRVFEWNACCKGGAREKASKAFAKQYADKSLPERIALIPQVPFMGVPTLMADGSILVDAVRAREGGRYACACSNFSHSGWTGHVPRCYCYCCAGHFLHHYQIMLGVKLRTAEIVSSPLDSGGALPCAMRFTILEA